MKRQIIAILMVFILIFAFASCQRLEESDNYEVATEPIYKDAEGNTREVLERINEEGETELFYVDDSGEEITIKQEDVVIETQLVEKQTERPTDENGSAIYTDDEKQVLKVLSDPDALENLVETEPEPEMEISEDVIDTSEGKEVEVELDDNGNPTENKVQTYYSNVSTSKKLTMDITISVTADGQTQKMPLTLMKWNDNLFVEASLPVEGGKIKCQYLSLNGTSYLLIPKIRVYMSMPDDLKEAFFTDQLTTDIEKDGTYVDTREVEIDKKTYTVETYETEEGTVKYYYLGNDLKRTEMISESETIIFEYNSIKSSVVTSKFRIPTGYILLDNYIGEDGTLSQLLD